MALLFVQMTNVRIYWKLISTFCRKKIQLFNLLPLVDGYRFVPKDPVDHPGVGLGTKLGPSPHIQSVPFHVLVFYPNFYCSGTIIGSKIVLTVASCFLKPDLLISVKVGTDSIADEGEIIPVVEYKIHEFYKYRSELDNDIALLVLEHGVTFSNKVKKITLLESEVALRDGSFIVVSGWGCTVTPPPRARQLTWSAMIVLDKEECYTIFGGLFTTSMFCAKYETPERLCDHGGPAVYSDRDLAGVTSFGATNANDPLIAIFTNVSYFYRWIKVNTQKFLHKYCKHDTEEDNDYDHFGAMERF